MLEYLSSHLKSPKSKRKKVGGDGGENNGDAVKVYVKVPSITLTFLSQQIPKAPCLPFLELSFEGINLGYVLKGNLESWEVEGGVGGVEGVEVGVDGRAERLIWRGEACWRFERARKLIPSTSNPPPRPIKRQPLKPPLLPTLHTELQPQTCRPPNLRQRLNLPPLQTPPPPNLPLPLPRILPIPPPPNLQTNLPLRTSPPLKLLLKNNRN